MFKNVMALVLVLAMGSAALAATATWSEEMKTTIAGSSTAWTAAGTWNVDLANGTWTRTGSASISTGAAWQPNMNMPAYTMEWKWQMPVAVPTTSGFCYPAFVQSYTVGAQAFLSYQGIRTGMGGPYGTMLSTEFYTRNASTIQNLWDGGYIHGWHALDWGTAWHTTRIVRDPTGAIGYGPGLFVFVDGALAEYFDILAGDTAKPKNFLVGADGSGYGYDVTWDYIRVYNGALPETEALVPEPMTMTLLGLGGLALIRRKH